MMSSFHWAKGHGALIGVSGLDGCLMTKVVKIGILRRIVEGRWDRKS